MIHPASVAGLLRNASITLTVNGAVRQLADIADMIWSVDEIIAELTKYYRVVSW